MRHDGNRAVNIPETCQAAVLVEYGAPLQIMDVAIPTDLEPNAILVKNLVSTLCGTDVHLWERTKLATSSIGQGLPVIPGHEMVGEVLSMNGNERDSIGQPLAVGDRIIWTHGFCGQCPECVIEHTPVLCRFRRGYMASKPTEFPYLNGGLAEYGYVYPTSGRVKVPDEIPDAIASAAACALRSVVQAFDRLGSIAERHTVLIQGAGPLGLFSVAKAFAASPEQIIMVGGPEGRLKVAREWGADETIDVTIESDPAARLDEIMRLTGGRGADVIIEVSGVPAAFNEGVAALRPGGRYVVVGQLHAEKVPFNPSQIVVKHAQLIGSSSAAVEHYARALTFLRNNQKRFDWTRMITSYQPLHDVNDALTRMRNFEEIKPAITFA